MRTIQIAPSLLAADFARLAEVVGRIEDHVDMLHLDVMDGHFVPNITFGIPVIASLRKATSLPFDCHLMTSNPDAYLGELAAAGADLVTMHIEAVPDPTSAAEQARAEGLRFGLVVNPPTPFEAIDPFIELCDMVVVMSVHAGFGGQSFIPEVLTKVEAARRAVEFRGLSVDIEIDGGIGMATAASARSAGANVFVAGTAIFRAPDPVAAAQELRSIVDN